jgi:hypothetical protein
MKKQTLLITMLLIACGMYAKPKFPPIKNSGLKLNILSPIYSNLSISYQHLLNPFRSIQVTAAYMDFNDYVNQNNDNLRVQGFSITPEYRMNFNGYGLNGFYAGPFLRYMDYQKTYDNGSNFYPATENSNFKSVGLGFNIGHQFIIKNTVLVDLFAGPVYQILVQEKVNRSIINPQPFYYDENPEYLAQSIPNRYLKGYGIRAGITIGIAF